MNYKIAQFEARVVGKPRGVLVMVPGSNQDGRDMCRGKTVRKWADKQNIATVGCHFEDIDPNQIEGYADASGGSGQALLDYLRKRALDHLPIYLWGFSAGGQFNYEFACWAPEGRVKGFVVNKGGFYYTALAPAATRQIPGLFFTGTHDDFSRQYIVMGIYLMNKRDDLCKWNIVQEKVGHVVGNSLDLSLGFFEELINKKD